MLNVINTKPPHAGGTGVAGRVACAPVIMLKRTLQALLILLTAYCSPLTAQSVDYTKWVNPFIGTGGHGHTFPGATMPFGMVQLSPDTRTDNWDGSSGYHYSDDIIYGFSHTHLSGTGIPDYCDILLMPSNGDFMLPATDRTIPPSYASKFSHENEKAEPGYYSVLLDRDHILTELTATARVGLHRYTFNTRDKANITLDLGWRDKVIESDIKLVSPTRIEGFRRSSSWAKEQTIFFVLELSAPYDKDSPMSVETGGTGTPPNMKWIRERQAIALRVNPTSEKRVLVKVALSPVSIEGARKNLAAELPGWDFDKVRADAKAAWNKELSKIEVSGGTDAQTTTFYTALYHTIIQPNVFNDVDGQYKGLDGKIHQLWSADTPVRMSAASARKRPLAGGTGDTDKSVRAPSEQYTVFSLWDTFRAAHPLYTIIDQKRTVDFINTFIRQYEQGGRLPVWELAGNETDCMIGYHAVSVIADAMAKGITGFDYEKAYAAAKHSAELDHFGLAAYKKRGYISMEDENESVSKTLEYAYDDWCIAQMAMKLKAEQIVWKWVQDARFDQGKLTRYNSDASRFESRSHSFENLFDPQTGFMRPKKNGGFISPFAPNEVTFNYTEGNAWVYTFFVPQDIKRLIELEGGSEKFAAKLDELFTTTDKLAGREQPDITGLIGQYAHGNEPSHHIAYLYDYAGQPWKTQKLVRQIMDEFYRPEPDGLIGNEDCGQMSAWYVLSAAGFYPVTPGNPSYDFGTPLFPKMIIHLENGKKFTVEAPSVSDRNLYIKSIKINGKAPLDWGIAHKTIMEGGLLEFEMSPVPTDARGISYIREGYIDRFVAVPYIEGGSRVFADKANIALKAITPDTEIHFTLDASEPNEKSPVYSAPITIDASAAVKAVAINKRGDKSLIMDATFVKKPNNWIVSIASKYSSQYTGGGDEGLVDGIRGTTSFASGEWQGYQGQDLIATVDLKKETEIKRVGGGFLQVARSWIWMPTHIEFEVSDDNVNFRKVADIKTDIAVTDMESKVRDYTQTIAPTKARYVRVHAYNLGKIPSWHPGAGGDAYIFVDEIIIG